MSVAKHMATYYREARKLPPGRPEALSVWSLICLYPAYRRALRQGATPLRDGVPWMTFGATRFLEENLTAKMRVFEYGAGGSTVFLANRVAEVVSVEHDAGWAEKVRAELRQRGLSHWKVLTIEPKPDADARNRDVADPDGYVSDDETHRSFSFRDYVSALENFPTGYFDWVFVDGRARPSCVKRAQNHLQAGGRLLLDNSERTYYERAAKALGAPVWQKRIFAGPVPYVSHFSETTIWERMS